MSKSKSARRAALVFTFLVLAPSAASAQFYVRQPEVERGEVELEEHGTVYSGLPSDDDALRQSHELEAKIGVDDRFEFIVETFLEEPRAEDLKVGEVEAGGQVELIEREGDGFGLAFRTIYEDAREADEADELLFGPIAKVAKGKLSSTLNLFFSEELGGGENDGPGLFYAEQVRYAISDHFGVGIEAFGEIEDLAHPGSFNDQEHRVGPALYLKLGGEDAETEGREAAGSKDEAKAEHIEVKLAAGVLFGISDATSDVAFKLDAEFEF